MRQAMLGMMAKIYTKLPDIASQKIDDRKIEDSGFLLSCHAAKVREVCRKHSYSISFRAAGQHTLYRIKQGHPCKGHTILNKSIKEQGEGYTYSISKEAFNAYKGLIGYSNSPENNNLNNVWALVDNKAKLIAVPPISNVDTNIYTGDYDMHDLLKYDGKEYVRILADTPDEHSAIDYFNLAMPGQDEQRFTKIKEVYDKHDKRTADSGYALIRHGAQTSFMCYLHGIAGSKELEKMLSKKDSCSDKIPWEDKHYEYCP